MSKSKNCMLFMQMASVHWSITMAVKSVTLPAPNHDVSSSSSSAMFEARSTWMHAPQEEVEERNCRLVSPTPIRTRLSRNMGTPAEVLREMVS
jgi:hypothetical protein